MKKNTISTFSALAYTNRDPDLKKELEKIAEHYGMSKAKVIRELIYQFGFKLDTEVTKDHDLRRKIKNDPHIQMMIERGLLKVA